MRSDAVDSVTRAPAGARADVGAPPAPGAVAPARAGTPPARVQDGPGTEPENARVSWEPVPFSAEPGSGPVTWGQLHMWHPMLRYGAAFATLSLKQVVPLPAPGVPPADCLAALRRLIETHQTLRTRFGDRSGTVRQTVASEGTHLVEVYELGEDGRATDSAVAAVAERRTRKLAAEPFRHSHEWPVRFSLVCSGRRVRAIAVVCSHVALDGRSVEQLCAALTRLLTGDAKTPAPVEIWQPLDQAAHEQSERGLRESARAMRHWRARLAEVPDTAPAPAAGTPAVPPVQQWWLTSTALAAATVVLAERTRTSSSAVLLTLAATALSAIRDQHTVPLLLISGNRFTERQKGLMAATVQDGLMVFERADVSFEDAVRDVYRRSTSGYMRAQYDPDALAALTAELDGTRRHPLDLTGYFNDARLSHDWRIAGPADAAARAAHLRSQRGPAFVRGYETNDMTFCLVLAQQGPDCQVSLLADTRHLAQERIPAILTGLEALLITALDQDLGLPEVPAALGLPAPTAQTPPGG
jgi:hypothetical protein